MVTKLALSFFTLSFLVNVVIYFRAYLHGNVVSLGDVWGWKLSRNVALVMIGMAILTIILNSLVGPSLKVTLDIFRYAVDVLYHRQLLLELDSLVDHIEACSDGRRRIAVVAHSLGTVIAIDSLVNRNCWRPTDSITLFTLGLPLKRFFFRFFPRLFFPASSLKCAQLIAPRVAGFRWMNCYRPWDQIGTLLGLPNVPGLKEESTEDSTSLNNS
jgi:hypothetical protein